MVSADLPLYSMFGAVIMRLVYGIDVDECDDKYLHTAEEAIAGFSLAFMPGRYLVETFPSMRYIPRWFPGAKFKQEAAEWRPAILSMRNKPYEDAVKAIVSISLTLAVFPRADCDIAGRFCHIINGFGPQGTCGCGRE